MRIPTETGFLGVSGKQTRRSTRGGVGEGELGVTELKINYSSVYCLHHHTPSRHSLHWPSFFSTLFGGSVYRWIESSRVLICPHWRTHASKTLLLYLLVYSVQHCTCRVNLTSSAVYILENVCVFGCYIQTS